MTKFEADYVDTEIDIVVGSDFTLDELYAWYKFNSTSANGIRLFYGAVTALDQANFVIDVTKADMKFDNHTATYLLQTDVRRISRSDGQYPVKRPTTGGGGIDIKWQVPVLIAETGVSGLTGPESALLAEIANVKAKTDTLPESPASEATSASIKERTDNLPNDPASEGAVTGVGSSLASIGTNVGDLNTKVDGVAERTDRLPDAPASKGDVMTAAFL